MAFDSFLMFSANRGGSGAAVPIVGESQDSIYKGCFEIKEFTFGAENTLNITSATGGAGAGKATFKEFKVKKQTDTATPYLLQTLGLGGHYDVVQLFIRKSGAATATGQSGKAYIVFAFGMVAVKTIDWTGTDGEDVPTEDVVFEFGELVVSYYPQAPTGILETVPRVGAWSKLTNSSKEMLKLVPMEIFMSNSPDTYVAPTGTAALGATWANKSGS
jgi:type VI secretion system secreted protein Hcp